MIRHLFFTVILALATSLPATAHHDGEQYRKSKVSVSHAWTGETGAMAHAIEVYLTIQNDGSEPITLTKAEIDFAQPGVFQAQVVSEDGTLRSREVSTVEIAAGQSVTMQPGGLRIVFNDVQKALHAGDHFHAHLEFAEIGELEVEVKVEDTGDGEEHDHEETEEVG
ncbi:MAG: copper chaperone PCu(A)C [Dichotomicrobium sp.]